MTPELDLKDIAPSLFLEETWKSQNLDDILSKAEALEEEVQTAFDGEDEDSREKLADLLSEIIDSPSEIAPDLEIDLRDLPEMPNFYSWCYDPQWGLHGDRPFAMQLAILTNLFAEWCPICSPSSLTDLEKIPVDFPAEDFPETVTFLEHGVCPECHLTRQELINSGHLNPYVEMDGVAGQRSGKTAMVRMGSTYHLHRWIKVEKPLQQLGLLSNDTLTANLCGLTFKRASDLLWTPIKRTIEEGSPWFSYLHEKLDYYSEKYYRDLYRIYSIGVRYNFKNIFLHPASPNKRTLRGDTRLLTLVDELGWFPHGEDNDERERASANEVYVALDRSLATVRSSVLDLRKRGYTNIPDALAVNIGSPSSYYDKIMTLYRTFKGSRDVYAWKLPTWKFNPKMPHDAPIITKAYHDNPITAERDYGANPPKSKSPYIEDTDQLKKLFKLKNSLKYRFAKSKSTSGHNQRYAHFTGGKISEYGRLPAVMTLDAGLSNNSFAISLCRLRRTPRKGQPFYIEVCGLAEIIPIPGEMELDYSRIEEHFLIPVIERFNVTLVQADRWQSQKFMSDLERKFDMNTWVWSLSGSDFAWVKENLIAATQSDEPEIIFPKLEMKDGEAEQSSEDYPHNFKLCPASHLMHQLEASEIDGRGVVEKTISSSDDILRAVVQGLSIFLDENCVSYYKLDRPLPSQSDQVIAVRGTSRPGSLSSLVDGLNSEIASRSGMYGQGNQDMSDVASSSNLLDPSDDRWLQ